MSRRYFASVPRVSANTDPALLPVSMTLVEVARYTRQSPSYLYVKVKDGTAQPIPVLKQGIPVKPYRWNRDTVLAHVKGDDR